MGWGEALYNELVIYFHCHFVDIFKDAEGNFVIVSFESKIVYTNVVFKGVTPECAEVVFEKNHK